MSGDDCLFCGIVAGDIPSYTVYEDDRVFAFLDANPLRRGHTLVIPKAHYTRVSELPGDEGPALFSVIGRLAAAVEAAMDADGTTIGFNDGSAAGQEIPHVHGHIIPRHDGDGAGALHSLNWSRPEEDEADFADVASEIRERVS